MMGGHEAVGGRTASSIAGLLHVECEPIKFAIPKRHTKFFLSREVGNFANSHLRGTEDEFVEAFNGVFAALTRECGENPHTAGKVAVTSSTSSWNEPFHVLDMNFEKYWYTTDTKGSYILFDMLTYRVRVSGYAVKTNFGPVGGWHLKSWILLGSDDGREWMCLDEQRGTSVLNGPNKWAKFTVEPIAWCRCIKLEMTDRNHWGDYALILSEFELFGELSSRVLLR
jgi:hypothetical protein